MGKNRDAMLDESTTLNVVIIAYACEPNSGSEPGTGWNIATRLANYANVTVVTRANNEEPNSKALAGYDGSKPSFIYTDPPAFILKLKKLKVLPIQIFYAFWQRKVAKELKKLFEKERVDIIHQITFNSFEVPPFIFLNETQAKLVWGPIGGAQSVEWNLLRLFGLKGGVKEWMRNIRVKISSYNPLCTKALKASSLVYFANYETRDLLDKHCRNRVEMMIDVGVDIEKFQKPPARPENAIPVVLFAGRLEGRKGAILLLKALELFKEKQFALECRIVGHGPDAEKLVTYVRENDLSDSVKLLGLVSHEEMTREFEQADIFAFPSLRDTSGAVVLEAMSMQLPTICYQHQGGQIMVNDETGIRVGLSTVDQMVNGLADGLQLLVEDPDMRRRMGTAARLRVQQEYDWDVRVQRMVNDYKRVLKEE